MNRTITDAEHVCTVHCEQGRGHYPEPAAPVVSDAAVKAAKAAIFKTYGQYDSGRTERIVETVLSAALPFLGPDGQHVISGECLHADDCPCFTITPRTDR